MAERAGPLSALEWRVVASTSVAHSLNHSLELTYAAVLPVLQREFGAGLFLLGVLSNLLALGYGLTALPGGFLADRLGSRPVIALALGVSGALGIAVALSPSLPLLAGALTLMGLAAGLYHPAGLSLISRGVRRRALALGYHGAGGNLGVALAPAVAGALAGLVSWRAAFLVFALLSLLVAFFFLTPLSEQAEEGAPASSPSRAGGSSLPLPALWPLVLVFGVNILVGFVFRGTITFLPLHLKEQAGGGLLGVDPVVVAGSFTTVALLFGAAGQYTGGHLGERVWPGLLLVPLSGLIALSLVLLGGLGGPVVVVGGVLFAFAYFMTQPLYDTLVAHYTPVRWRGRAFGVLTTLGFTLGSFGAGFSGYVAEGWGTAGVFWALSGVAGLTALLSLPLLRTRRPA